MRAHVKLMNMFLGMSLSAAAIAAPASIIDLDALRKEQAQISAAVSAGEPPYDGMSSHARNALLERQAAVLKLIESRRSAEELAPHERAQLEESLQWIEKAIVSAEDSRQVCANRKTLGSNRKERVCTTSAQQREQREAARRQMQGRETR